MRYQNDEVRSVQYGGIDSLAQSVLVTVGRMHTKARYIQEVLASLDTSTRVQELPDTTRSAAEAASAVGTSTAQIAKSLVFQAGDRIVLVIASGSNRVSANALAEQLAEDVTQPDAKTTKKLTGYSAGGVPPVGHGENPPTTFLDEDLLQYDTIWAAAGTPHAVFSVAPGELVRITAAKVIPVTA